MSDATPVPHEPLPPDRLRVGDAERYEAAAALGEHFATGRLDQEEYDARVRSAYAARTRGDLEVLFGDLPDPAPFRPPSASGWAAGRAARERVGTGPGRRLPVPPLVLLLPLLIAATVLLRFPVFPLFFLFWFVWGRRAWR